MVVLVTIASILSMHYLPEVQSLPAGAAPPEQFLALDLLASPAERSPFILTATGVDSWYLEFRAMSSRADPGRTAPSWNDSLFSLSNRRESAITFCFEGDGAGFDLYWQAPDQCTDEGCPSAMCPMTVTIPARQVVQFGLHVDPLRLPAASPGTHLSIKVVPAP